MSVVHINKETFQEEVLNCEKPVLLDFFAEWCGPCKMISPTIMEIAEENEHIKVCKIDVDEAPELAIRFGINSIPTLIVMENGKLVNQAVGLRSKKQILDMLP